MKILSLNTNDFGGFKEKPRYNQKEYMEYKEQLKHWKADEKYHQINAKELIKYIKRVNPHIINLQEFDINSSTGKMVIEDLKNISYHIVYPNETKKEDYDRGEWSIAVMFVKDKELDSENKLRNFTKTSRSVEIDISECRIIGVHVPYKITFWEAMIDYYKKNRDKKLMFIGDMNVYCKGTNRKKKFNELLSLGAVDAWDAKKYPTDKPTFNSGARIDYALMTPSLYKDLIDIKIDDTLRNQCITDHSAIIVELL